MSEKSEKNIQPSLPEAARGLLVDFEDLNESGIDEEAREQERKERSEKEKEERLKEKNDADLLLQFLEEEKSS